MFTKNAVFFVFYENVIWTEKNFLSIPKPLCPLKLNCDRYMNFLNIGYL
jgi:hypothetical protein